MQNNVPQEAGLLREERHRRILDALRRHGKVIVGDLSGALDVSEDTIRRDLRELADAGLLQRVHGGALPRSPAVAAYAARQTLAPAAKVAIAHSKRRPSSLTLPVVSDVAVPTGLPPCPGLRGEPCRDYQPFANRRGS